MPEITYRPGTPADSPIVFNIFELSVLDLGDRLGVETISGGQDEAAMAELWARRRPLFEHLARTAEQFWIAEQDGQAIGYARSVKRDGLFELTEFFVLPGQQSAGVGRELLKRTFPSQAAKPQAAKPQAAKHRVIVATPDTRALARYLKVGVYPRFATNYFSRRPEDIQIDSDLTFEPVSASPEVLVTLGALDIELLGHQRAEDHAWLLENRQGYLYRRAGQLVGYGYVADYCGPFALLNEHDFPAVLAHAERNAMVYSDEFGLEVPLINRAAVDYLLSRGFRMESFFTLFMSDEPFGKFENYLFPSPPFFI